VPARVIINDKNEVVHFSKRAGVYLLMPEGKPTRDLLKMAREELRPALRAAIYKAFSQQQEITYRGIAAVTESGETTINITVLPLMEPPLSGRQALVIIEPAAPSPVQFLSSEEVRPGDEASRNALARHLEDQLRVTGEQLQSTCEQLETSNERFTLANEELMTVNEELQSTNEELQSTNEELVTVNSELQRKMEELNQSNSDLENLFTSSEVAIVFLDRELSIKRFSSAMGAVLNLTPNDIGRAIHHINITIDFSTLLSDSRQVLEDLVPVEREATSKDGRSFIMHLSMHKGFAEKCINFSWNDFRLFVESKWIKCQTIRTQWFIKMFF
jgi:two-component system CheB/CheR fusion protein